MRFCAMSERVLRVVVRCCVGGEYVHNVCARFGIGCFNFLYNLEVFRVVESYEKFNE